MQVPPRYKYVQKDLEGFSFSYPKPGHARKQASKKFYFIINISSALSPRIPAHLSNLIPILSFVLVRSSVRPSVSQSVSQSVSPFLFFLSDRDLKQKL